MDETIQLVYRPTPTILRFHESRAHLKFVCGPPGGGKSVGMVQEGLFRAMRQEPGKDGVRRSKFGIFRSTYPRLHDTTLKTFREWIPSNLGLIKESAPYQGVIRFPLTDGTRVELEVLMMSIGEDLQAVKSLELSFAWINEPSELTNNFNSVLVALEERTNRYPSFKTGVRCTYPGVFCDFNMVGKEHPLYQTVMSRESFTVQREDGSNFTLTKEFFPQPPSAFCLNLEEVETEGATPIIKINPEAENVENLGPDYYPQKVAGLLNPFTTESWLKLKSEHLMMWVGTSRGKLVFPEFSRDRHVALARLDIIPSLPVIMGVDTSGLHPAAVLGQIVGKTLHITDVLYGDDMPLKMFVEDLVVPTLQARYSRCPHVLAICDPANARDSLTGVTPVQTFIKAGIPAKIAMTNKPVLRRRALSTLLLREGGILLDPDSAAMLTKALETDHIYKPLRSLGLASTLYSQEPLKNEASHPCDAVGYLATYIVQQQTKRTGDTDRLKQIQQQLHSTFIA